MTAAWIRGNCFDNSEFDGYLKGNKSKLLATSMVVSHFYLFKEFFFFFFFSEIAQLSWKHCFIFTGSVVRYCHSPKWYSLVQLFALHEDIAFWRQLCRLTLREGLVCHAFELEARVYSGSAALSTKSYHRQGDFFRKELLIKDLLHILLLL